MGVGSSTNDKVNEGQSLIVVLGTGSLEQRASILVFCV